MSRALYLALALAALTFGAAGCARSGAAEPGKYDGEVARRWVEDGAVLLDVRTPAEFDAGHLAGAVNIPVQELGRRLHELEGAEDVVIYCRSGNRSAHATRMLEAAGHEVYDLGPMTAW